MRGLDEVLADAAARGVRVQPAVPAFVDDAERVVFEALLPGLPAGSYVLVGQRFTDDDGDHEADLVVAVPGWGVATIEVKGGHVTWERGAWWQSGRRRKEIDPTGQSRRCMYAVRSFVDRQPVWGRRRVRMVHLVAFPYSAVPAGFEEPATPRWSVIDRDDLADAAGVVRRALDRWATDRPRPTAADVADFEAALAGQMLPQRDMVAEALASEGHCNLLTEAQARMLDYLRHTHRLEVRGGAGSGKTWLAVEQARRLARQGHRVGLLCYSRGLAEFLRRRVELMRPEERPAYVGTFHALGERWGAPTGSDDDSAFWEQRLPAAIAELAAAQPVAERFDDFVVDEAQDFADAWWPALLEALRDPDDGGLFVFSDEGQRVFARQGRPPVTLLPVDLDENLRNTKRIAQTFGSLAPAQMRYRGLEGVPVRFVPCASSEAVTCADDEAVRLLDDGWLPEHVALLTTYHRHPEHRERIARDGQAAYWQSYWEGDDVFYGHVLGFKGLERAAVVLAVNGFRDAERAREMLYVGLSRARDLLVVCGDLDLIRDVGGEGVVRRLTAGVPAVGT